VGVAVGTGVGVAVAAPRGVGEAVGEGWGPVVAEQAVIHADSVRTTAARVALALRPLVGNGALASPCSRTR
jgi:hypothetical protein